MEDQAIVTLLTCHDVEEKNSEQLKPISAQKKQALDALKQRLIQQKKTCMTLNDKWYVVLQTHDVKPKLTSASVGILLHAFLTSQNIVWNQADIDAFVKFIDIKLCENTTHTQVAKLTDKKPLGLMINKV